MHKSPTTTGRNAVPVKLPVRKNMIPRTTARKETIKAECISNIKILNETPVFLKSAIRENTNSTTIAADIIKSINISNLLSFQYTAHSEDLSHPITTVIRN